MDLASQTDEIAVLIIKIVPINKQNFVKRTDADQRMF
jgi:hypothetical protein